MHSIFITLLILLGVIWTVAVVFRSFGLPTVMGELVGGVIVGPAILGWVEPTEMIEVLAQMGIFFLMLHAGVETRPREFLSALRSSLGVALVGAIVPFSIAFATGLAFGLSVQSSIFIGLTMTATAVVITIKALQDLGLQDAKFARIIVASCVIDDLLTLVLFSIILGVLQGQAVNAAEIAITCGKVIVFFATSLTIGYYIYPLLKFPFTHISGKGFTFVLLIALAAGLFAEWIGLHMIIGAYIAGLFFEPEVAHPALVQKVKDRLYGIAYSFLGPIFFISLGFHVTFEIFAGEGVWMILVLTSAVFVGQILSAGGMALRIELPPVQAFTVGVGMCGRAEMAFILAALGLQYQLLDNDSFTVVIITAFILNLLTVAGLKVCAHVIRV